MTAPLEFRRAAPHQAMELGVPRRPVAYRVAIPAAGVSAGTGVILYVHGWGARYDDAYANRLLPWLANSYDCLAVAVDYQGAAAQVLPPERPAPDFFRHLERHHGVTVSAPAGMPMMTIVNRVAEALAEQGIRELHPHCVLLKGAEGHINFGLLPALDNLQALWEVLARFAPDRRRLFLLGTSYGGYVALLMAKMAPGTFRLVVDNSGFSGPDKIEAVYGLTLYTGPVRIVTYCPQAFTRQVGHPRHFSAARRLIRLIAAAGHYRLPSDTVIYSYHSATDRVAPVENRLRDAALLSGLRRHNLSLIGEGDLDGRIFKTLDHGLGASMRGLFDLSYRRWLAGAPTAPETTDFDLGTVNPLPCEDRAYTLHFDESRGVGLEIG